MKTVRYNVFETNSSSNHSFSLSDGDTITIRDNNLIPDENGIIELTGGEFGWGMDAYTDPLTKANYLAVYCDLYTNDDYKWNMVVEVIKEYTGATDVISKVSSDWEDPCYSYIDHDSTDVPSSLFYNKNDLIKFIFDSNSVLYITNDNDTLPPNFYDKPGTKYNYELIIPTLKSVGFQYYSAKFYDYPSDDEIIKSIDALIGYREQLIKTPSGELLERDISTVNKGIEYTFPSKYEVQEGSFDRKGNPNVRGEVKRIDIDKKEIYLYNSSGVHMNFLDKLVLTYEINDLQAKE